MSLRSSMVSFSREGYRQLLESALETGYSFNSFLSAEERTCPSVCLLRHDVDADVAAALEMAEIEKKLGVRATYFFMLRSPLYNLFSRSSTRAIERILSFGHHLGLHFDASFVPDGISSVADLLQVEGECLARMFQVTVNVFSLHQPTATILHDGIDAPGWVNAYTFNDHRGYYYISDSNMKWRAEPASEVFSNRLYPKVHLLIHPMWWVYGDPKNEETEVIWDRAILSNFEQAQEQLLLTERAFGERRKMTLQ